MFELVCNTLKSNDFESIYVDDSRIELFNTKFEILEDKKVIKFITNKFIHFVDFNLIKKVDFEKLSNTHKAIKAKSKDCVPQK